MQRTLRLRGFHLSKIPKVRRACLLRNLSGSAMKQSKINLDDIPLSIQQNAALLEFARSNNLQIPPLSEAVPDLDQRHGYHIAAAIRIIREHMNGDIVAGRKIGFTNRNIWPEYGIDASNWSYMYQNTIIDLTTLNQAGDENDTVDVDISHLSGLEPRVEPEIVLGLATVPSSSMTDKEVLQCIDWIGHGFEIVASVFPKWKFTAPDTTAAFALHGTLLIGSKVPIQTLVQHSTNQFLDQLASFNISLYQNGEMADEGKGSNVLGSAIKALRHLVELLEVDEFNDHLSPGETITTGTLTRALPISHEDVWSTKITGIGLPGLRVKFNLDGTETK